MKHITKYLVPALMLGLDTLLPTGFAAETPATKPVAKPKAIPAQTGNSAPEILKRMTAELKLTQEQQQKVKMILDATEQKMVQLSAATNLTPQEIGLKGREVRAATDKQLREVLTPAQYQQWQKILAQRGRTRRPEGPPGAAAPPKASPPQSGGGPAEKQ